MPSDKLARDKYLDVDEFRALLRAAGQRRHKNAIRDRALFALAGECGLRSCEALALAVSDCDGLRETANPYIRVHIAKRKDDDVEDVAVPRENVLLGPGGFKQQIAGFNIERIGNTARSLANGWPRSPQCRASPGWTSPWT